MFCGVPKPHVIGQALWIFLSLILELGRTPATAQDSNIQEYCENDVFNATCGSNEVVLMTSAHYGRMRMTRCVKLDYGHMGCMSDVIDLIDGKCSGRHQCAIGIPEPFLSQTLPCPDDLKPYLEAGYKCIRVHSPRGEICNKEDLSVSGAEGYLSNVVTQETGCGGIHSPWIITVQRGQTISVHLLDFAISKRREGIYSYTQCQIYGEIRERTDSGPRNYTVCGISTREKLVYSSATNQIEIAFKIPDKDLTSMPYYIFRYEAIGCPDRRLPAGSHAIRQRDGIIVKCNGTNDVFHLKCVGRAWVGELRNCSKSSVNNKIVDPTLDDLGIPYGLSILIVLAIALVIGLFVLFVGLVFLKKQRGLCLRRRGHDSSSNRHMEDTYDKQYVRSPWIQAREDGSTISSVTTKPAPWREGTYGHAPSLISDLPPCTPLMDRGNRPPSYGQVLGQRSRLACGCHLDGNAHGDLCDYPSRHEILATTCPVACPGGTCTPPANRNPNPNPDRLILKPGDRAQYFVVDHNASIYSVRTDMNTPRIERPKVETSNPKPAGTVHMQTDDVKLKLKVTDKPQCTFPASCREDCDKNEPCPESRPLISESPRRQSPRRQQSQPSPRRPPPSDEHETYQLVSSKSNPEQEGAP